MIRYNKEEEVIQPECDKFQSGNNWVHLNKQDKRGLRAAKQAIMVVTLVHRKTSSSGQKFAEPGLDKKYERYIDYVATKIAEQRVCRVDPFMELETIRRALKKRGFIEVFEHPWHAIVPFKNMLERADTGNEYEKALLALMVGDCPADYQFTMPINDYDKFADVRMLSMLKFKDTNFGFKEGLCRCIERININLDRNKSKIPFPRSYDVIDGKELYEFHKDYRLTVATSIVLYLNEQSEIRSCFSTRRGTIKARVIKFAFHAVVTRIQMEEGQLPARSDFDMLEIVWNQIHQAYVDLIKKRKKIQADKDEIPELIDAVRFLTGEIYRYWPSRKYDGYRNIWLLKVSHSPIPN